MKTEKGFHCVEFKHEAQKQIYKDIKNMTPEQEIEYFRRRAESRHNMTTAPLPHHPHHP